MKADKDRCGVYGGFRQAPRDGPLHRSPGAAKLERENALQNDCFVTTWIVTGGAGFIGSNFVRSGVATTSSRIVVFDALTYAGHMESLEDLLIDERLVFVKGDPRRGTEACGEVEVDLSMFEDGEVE